MSANFRCLSVACKHNNNNEMLSQPLDTSVVPLGGGGTPLTLTSWVNSPESHTGERSCLYVSYRHYRYSNE